MRKSSKYKGVSYCVRKTGSQGEILHSRGKPWQAYINVNGKKRNLGGFSTEKQAAIAVDMKVIELNLQQELNILKKVAI